jgi:hypothetical protein
MLAASLGRILLQDQRDALDMFLIDFLDRCIVTSAATRASVGKEAPVKTQIRSIDKKP